MSAMPRRPHTNDLFALFPDLPWTRFRTTEEQVAAVRTSVAAMQRRAAANIRRQREEAERIRLRLSARVSARRRR
jgi:hypothetical protein